MFHRRIRRSRKLTVEENLAFMAGLWGADTAGGAPRGRGYHATHGLAPRRHDYARTLSGGWQRRLSIAMALITGPRVLFTGRADAGAGCAGAAGAVVGHLVPARAGDADSTTHYLEEAEALSDRIGIMAGGRLRALGTAAGLCAQAGKDTLRMPFVALATGEKGGRVICVTLSVVRADTRAASDCSPCVPCGRFCATR